MSDKTELTNKDLKQVSGGSEQKHCTDPNRGTGYYSSCTSPDRGKCEECSYCHKYMHLEDQ